MCMCMYIIIFNVCMHNCNESTEVQNPRRYLLAHARKYTRVCSIMRPAPRHVRESTGSIRKFAEETE